jgi:hypothetical protein
MSFSAFFRQGTPQSMSRLVAFLYALCAILLCVAIGLVAVLEPDGEHAAGIIAALGVPFAAVVGGSWSALGQRVKQRTAEGAGEPSVPGSSGDRAGPIGPLAEVEAVHGAGARTATD